jgi:hypothetical protein
VESADGGDRREKGFSREDRKESREGREATTLTHKTR